jgi:hypothetical protein
MKWKSFKIDGGLIHGSSYALHVDNIEFITWRLNEDSGEYWVKLHLPSGKEVRIKVDLDELQRIVDWKYQGNYELEIGVEYGLD